MQFDIPLEIQTAIDKLEINGFEAYLVGGCVRDYILNIKPHDFDICTSALPNDMKRIFNNYSLILSGEKHGTVGIVINKSVIEITTYRIEGNYSDNRHPDSVSFKANLKDDLARRDFTINSLAYNTDTGIIDFFGGLEDIKSKIIRCVGDSNKRFKEDGLRILRALRFSSVLGFTIESNTRESILKNKKVLENISVERTSQELYKLICGNNSVNVLMEYAPIFFTIMPELENTYKFNQNNYHHIYDVFEHSVIAMSYIPPNPVLRLTMLLHDIGKPSTYTEDKNGIGHFRLHGQVGSVIAKKVVDGLKLSSKDKSIIVDLVRYHNSPIYSRKDNIKKWLNAIGEEKLKLLIIVKRSDCMAKSPKYIKKNLLYLDSVEKIYSDIINSNECYNLKRLAINGKDLMELGINGGKKIGRILSILLCEVMQDKISNTKEILLTKAKYLINHWDML